MTAYAHVVDDESVATPSSGTDSGRSVREFEAICAKHSLACGAPEDFAPFLAALAGNKLLAMNFWSVVARLSDGRHGSALSQEQILSAIVQAVAGQSKDKAAEAHHGEIAQLARMLAGEDVATPQPPVGESQLPASAPQPSPAPEDALRNGHSDVTQLRLDTEPLESVPAPGPADRIARPKGRSRLVLAPDHSRPHTDAHQPPLVHRNAPLRTEEPAYDRGEPRISIPLSAYAGQEDARRPARRIGAVLLTLVLLCGATLFLLRGVTAWRQPGNTVQQAFASFVQRSSATLARVRNAIHNSSPAAHSTVATAPALSSGSGAESPPVAPAEAAPAATSGVDTTSSASTPDRNAASTGAPSAPSELPSSPATGSHYAAPAARMEGSPRAGEDVASADDGARDAALVQVPGREMRNHLFASRFPIIPDTANADAVSGVVTLHAVVTSRGTVEHAYAISGPPALRQPAIDAVSGWRYRPYMLNGSPIDVSTTIRVDFSGND